ncbi:unnamed protein product, partial [Echinostoma caproni]|uniref:Zf-XS domain-containing protein n=1 Tax=Echinostoma caproni TaxID=27848 RepID=A0A183A710_9TREM
SSQPESSLGRGRGRGRGRGGPSSVRGGRGRATAPSVMKSQTKLDFSAGTKKPTQPRKQAFDISEDEEEEPDNDFAPSENGGPPAPRSPRMNARRAVTDKARYVFDLESSEESDADGSDSGSRHPPAAGKRKARRSDDDDDFDPKKISEKKYAFYFQNSRFSMTITHDSFSKWQCPFCAQVQYGIQNSA